jgi:hypothetical protein
LLHHNHQQLRPSRPHSQARQQQQQQPSLLRQLPAHLGPPQHAQQQQQQPVVAVEIWCSALRLNCWV